MRKYEESILQRQCVAWFRAQYPQYAMLLIHVANEGNGNRVSGAIHKAEGVVKGVPDLILFLPSVYIGGKVDGLMCHGLGIEMKTAKGKQSQEQKDFQQIFEAAYYKYVVVRTFDEFCDIVNLYLGKVTCHIKEQTSSTHQAIVKASEEREREKFYKVLGKGANDGKKTK